MAIWSRWTIPSLLRSYRSQAWSKRTSLRNCHRVIPGWCHYLPSSMWAHTVHSQRINSRISLVGRQPNSFPERYWYLVKEQSTLGGGYVISNTACQEERHQGITKTYKINAWLRRCSRSFGLEHGERQRRRRRRRRRRRTHQETSSQPSAKRRMTPSRLSIQHVKMLVSYSHPQR